MFELVRSSTLRGLLSRQAPALAISILIAELFYKLGSFTLECIAFLVTWFLVDWILASLTRFATKRAAHSEH